MLLRVRPYLPRLLTYLVIGLFLCWSAAFIWKSSIPLSSGERVYCLFDDAMVSMRYADNLVRGHGLVWNAGERVEGYTNPLMVAVMAVMLAVFGKSTATVLVQILGVVLVVCTALLTLRTYQNISDADYRLPSWFFLPLVFGIYTLSYWSLMGMETGLVAMFLALGVNIVLTKEALPQGKFPASSLLLVVTAAGLYFSRPDALAYAVVLFFFHWLAPPRRPFREELLPVLCVAGIVIAHIALRYAFYGELLPNTATLKLGGFPLPRRILGGTGFILPFLENIYAMLALAVLSFAFARGWKRGLLLILFGLSVSYQVFVGGDPWPYWRIMTPTIPLLMALAADGAARLSVTIFERQSSQLLIPAASLVMLVGALHSYDRPFIRELGLLVSPYTVEANKENVNIAFALRDVTKSTASVGVVWAGSIPFYTERYAIDFLGKSDPDIAALDPELRGPIQWAGMPTVPGHNKYNLAESIVRRRPTYIQTTSWGSDDVTEWADANYVKVEYLGHKMLLLKDSPDVYWDRVTPVSAHR